MKFNHLNVPEHWQNYWSRYPEGYTILEALISWVSQVDSMVDNQNKLNTNVEQFRNEIDAFVGRFDERLQDEVTITLKDWQASGFLDEVINTALQWQLDDYITTNELDKNSINQQLQQKAIKGEIGLVDMNKNITQFDETWFADSVKQQWAGNSPVNATPPDSGVTTAKLANEAVTSAKRTVSGDFGVITAYKPIEVDFDSLTVTIPYSTTVGANQVNWRNKNYQLPSEIAFSLDTPTGSNLVRIYFNTKSGVFKTFNNSLITAEGSMEDWILIATALISQRQFTSPSNFIIKDNTPVEKEKNIFEFPNYPVWGHEYMINWYKMILDESDLTMSFAGDSTTHGAGVVSEPFKRHNIAKKIMVKGGYEATKITTLNKGHEATHTGNWISDTTYPQREGIDPIPQYGYLHEDMQEKPNIYVVGHGINDGSSKHWEGTTLQQRIDGFESRLREGLGRIRTNGTYPSGPSYGRGPDDLTIILTMPNSTYREDNEVMPELWHNAIRPIMKKLAREFKCGFVDIAQRQYDHQFTNSWSSSDFIHPIDATNADYMSLFNDILYPIGLQK